MTNIHNAQTTNTPNGSSPLGGTRGGLKVGILGAAGYTGGELIRLLLNHPEVEIVFANSESNAGNLFSDVHEGLLGETEQCFTAEMPFDKVDVVFFCFGHGKSEAFLKEHSIPANVKIIDLAQDFRIKGNHDYVYGLPEIHREEIAKCQHLANPGCFATCIQLGLLPLAQAGLLTKDIAVNAITGSTGAGQKPGATTHFSWRNNNFSVYKLFTHQHLHEICQTLNELKPATAPHVVDTLDEGFEAEGITVDFIPYRGDFARGIFCTEVVTLEKQTLIAPSDSPKGEGNRPDGNTSPLGEDGKGLEGLLGGSFVRLKGQTTIGQILKISGNEATVVFGQITTNVKLSRLEPAEAPKKEKNVAATFVSVQTRDDIRKTTLNFKEQLDVRGMRGDEAVQAVTYFIDDALVARASRVKILHGTGTGALKTVIRQYLNTMPPVADFYDEDIRFGGAGITIVELV